MKIAQKLPKVLDHKASNFQQYIIYLRHKHQFPLSNIGYMDETPMNYAMIANKMVETISAKTVEIRSIGH